MQAAAILNYPEFIIAGLLGAVMLWIGPEGKPDKQWHFPQWLAQPARACLTALPSSYISWLIKMQTWAGIRNNFALSDLSCYKIYGSISSFLLACVIPVWAAALASIAAFFAADIFLVIRVKRRNAEILHALPQALDLMVLCVDAGLGLDATIQRIAAEKSAISNALHDELLHLNRDILLGMERETAYRELFRRTGVDELKSFGSALNQASKLGLSIGKVLRSQGEYLRLKQGQKAEAKAMKLPVYMAFPLWFCIMPTLMVILLAPSLITFFQQTQSQFGLGF